MFSSRSQLNATVDMKWSFYLKSKSAPKQLLSSPILWPFELLFLAQKLPYAGQYSKKSTDGPKAWTLLALQNPNSKEFTVYSQSVGACSCLMCLAPVTRKRKYTQVTFPLIFQSLILYFIYFHIGTTIIMYSRVVHSTPAPASFFNLFFIFLISFEIDS